MVLGVVIAGALYVQAMRRGQRGILSDPRKDLAERGAQHRVQPELLPQTEAQKPAEIDTGLIRPDEAKAPGAGSLIIETVSPQEEESPAQVAVTREGEFPPTRDPLATKVGAVGGSDIPDNRASIDEQGQAAVDEDLHGGDDHLPHQPTRVTPEKRGGRSRATAQEGDGEKAVRSRWRFQKPEIICWNKSREWILAVELPEELEEAQEVSVSQNGMVLPEDELEKGCWRIAGLRGEVVVQAAENDDVHEIRISLGYDDHLLFKLSGAGLDRGRCVSQPSSGSYLVIVPEDWERCQELAGTAPATPEPVCLEGFRAHCFDLWGDSRSRIAFRDCTGRSIELGSTGPHFELVGQQVHDASENMGPLFGGQTPSISITDGSWGDIGIIVLGEEGSGRGRRRTSLKLNRDLAKQQMPDEIASRKAGWYFVRFYNLENELIDSLDFRFAAGLERITFQDCDAAPSAAGHQVVTVEIQHDADWCVVRSCASSGGVNVECTGEKTILTIPPMQDFDQSQWLLGLPGGPQVEVSILVERIWWAISGENIPPGQWTDKQLAVTRDDLQATSNKALWMRLPKPRWSHSVLVGFNRVRARPYQVLVTERAVAVPLRDFGDAPEIDTVGEFSLRLWVSHQEETYETSACKLVVKACCTFDDFSATTEGEALQHIKTKHLHELTRLLTWDEHRQRMPTLPTVIFKCSYCPSYVRADNLLHPTNAIIDHIANDCKGVTGRAPPIHFRRVEDVEEIRQNVIANLPRIHKCTICNDEFEDFDEADLWRHMVERHKSRFLDLR